jgi:hypothetical protein
MSDTPKPGQSSEQPPDVPGPLPELPSLDPLEPEEDGDPSDGASGPGDVPIVQPPGTQ